MPNSKRRGFKSLISDDPRGADFRMAGVAVFLTMPSPWDPNRSCVVLGFDRRAGTRGALCATAQGGVPGQDFLGGAVHELKDELFVVGSHGGAVTHLVPLGMMWQFHVPAPTPFGVEVTSIVEAGELSFVDFFDHTEEGYVTALYQWDLRVVDGMTPLLASSAGFCNLAWQDAFIPLQGVDGVKAPIQGTLLLFNQELLQGGLQLESAFCGMAQGTQGYMPLSGGTGIAVHPR